MWHYTLSICCVKSLPIIEVDVLVRLFLNYFQILEKPRILASNDCMFTTGITLLMLQVSGI